MEMFQSQPTNRLSKDIISRLEDIGRAREALTSILNQDVFSSLQKDDVYWECDNVEECSKLKSLRIKLMYTMDSLFTVLYILDRDDI